MVLRSSASMSGRRWWIVAVTAAAVSLGIIGALTVGRLHLVDPLKPSTLSYVVPDPGNRREAFVTSVKTLEHPRPDLPIARR